MSDRTIVNYPVYESPELVADYGFEPSRTVVGVVGIIASEIVNERKFVQVADVVLFDYTLLHVTCGGCGHVADFRFPCPSCGLPRWSSYRPSNQENAVICQCDAHEPGAPCKHRAWHSVDRAGRRISVCERCDLTGDVSIEDDEFLSSTGSTDQNTQETA